MPLLSEGKVPRARIEVFGFIAMNTRSTCWRSAACKLKPAAEATASSTTAISCARSRERSPASIPSGGYRNMPGSGWVPSPVGSMSYSSNIFLPAIRRRGEPLGSVCCSSQPIPREDSSAPCERPLFSKCAAERLPPIMETPKSAPGRISCKGNSKPKGKAARLTGRSRARSTILCHSVSPIRMGAIRPLSRASNSPSEPASFSRHSSVAPHASSNDIRRLPAQG